VNAYELAIARKLNQLKLQPAPLNQEDLQLLAACERAVAGFEHWRALHEADAQRRAERQKLRKANGLQRGRYQTMGSR
jgi:hypothetical protein